jgi:hypothetical protein
MSMLIPNDMSLTKLCLDSSLFNAKLFVRRNVPALQHHPATFRFAPIAAMRERSRLAFRSNAYRSV